MKLIKILLIFLLLFLFQEGNAKSVTNNNFNDMDINIIRFDQEFASLNTSNFLDKFSLWDTTLNGFHRFYIDQYLPFSEEDSSWNQLIEFIENDDVKSFNIEVNNAFDDLDKIFDDLKVILVRMKKILPSLNVPKHLIIVNSFQTYSVATLGDTIIVGLDMYLGENSIYYNDPEYLNFRKSHRFLVADILENWLTNLLPKDQEGSFINELIYRGKIMYLLHKIMIGYSPQDIMRFDKEKLDWCYRNQKNIWMEIQRLGLSNSIPDRSFFYPARSTYRMTEDSPGRLGYWVGYRVVDEYMKKTKSSLTELIINKNPSFILEKSEYNPQNRSDKNENKDKRSVFQRYWWALLILLILLLYLSYYFYKTEL